jgi:hypothetical protein
MGGFSAAILATSHATCETEPLKAMDNIGHRLAIGWMMEDAPLAVWLRRDF